MTLLGFNLKTGKIIHSDDPDLSQGDIICNQARALTFDERLSRVTSGRPLSWFKVKDPKKPTPEAVFTWHCHYCGEFVAAAEAGQLEKLKDFHIKNVACRR